MSRVQPAWVANLHWEQCPDAISHRDVAGVAVDAADQVYLFTRSDHQVLVYTAAGTFVRAWGAGIFTNAHSIRIGPDGAVYCVDNGDHSVRKFTPDGELLLTLGVPGTPSRTGYRTDLPVRIHNVETVARPAGPFNGCTDIAIAPDGDIFVSDGYGNCRVHHFGKDGMLLNSWGEVGSGPGQFRLPHGICLTPDGRLLVADRENDRIQIFRTDGSYLGEWSGIQRPSGLALTSQGDVVVAELWRPADNRSFVTDTTGVDQPGRVSVLSPSGELLSQWGASADDKAAEGNVIAPHSVAVDSADSVYVGEVTYTYGIKPGRVPGDEDHASHQIQKFTAQRVRRLGQAQMAMWRSTDRILTTHGGNLPRPADLEDLISGWRDHQPQIEARLPSAITEVVEKQLDCGVTILNEGEYVKAASGADYVGYIHSRVTGWETRPIDPAIPPKRGGVAERDRLQFPGFYESGLWLQGSGGPVRPGFFRPGAPPAPTTERVCTSPVRYVGYDAIGRDVAELVAAVDGRDAQGFIAALGPLSLGAGARNEYYPDEESYMMAVAEVMREEYKAVTDAGLVLQVDEPEFATTWMFYPDWSIEDYRRYLSFAVEVINHAIAGLPEDQIRFHVCWGSGHRPHVNDVPLKDIADLLVKINATAYAVEAGNVRHSHEWRVWEDVKLPDGKTLVPGVISHATDLVEHPELVAMRLMNFASVVGRENVQAGTDCGIGSRVGHPEIVWAKLAAMAEGAALASKRLWK